MVEGHNVWRHCTEQFLSSIQWNRLYWGRHLQEFHFHELTVSLKFYFIRVVFTWKLKVRAGYCTSHCIVVTTDWLFVCCFMSHLRIFHSSKDIKVKRNKVLTWHLWPLCRERSFTFHGLWFLPNLFAFYHTDGYVVLTVCIRLRVVISKEFENFFFKNKYQHFT